MSKNSPNETETIPIIPAATMVIMHRDPNGGAAKILMMERVKTMSFAGGAAVFPGGKVDAADFKFARDLADDLTLGLDENEAAARLAAIRETIEEAGLALGLNGVGDPADCALAREALNNKSATLADICGEFGWTPNLTKLFPWARWRPPMRENLHQIFDTRFYLVDAGAAPLDAVVDSTENVALFWASADEALELADAGKIKVIFPTRRNLERLAPYPDFAAAAAHAAKFPVRTVQSFMEDRGEERFLCIPDGHGYPVIEESMLSVQRG